MTATVALSRAALVRRIQDLSFKIQATRDALDKLDLIQQRCEAQELLAGTGIGADDLAPTN